MNKVIVLMTCIFVCGMVTSCSIIKSPDTPPPPQNYQLQGVVANNVTGERVHEALVTLDGLSTTTNRKGVYRFRNVLEGDNKQLKVISEHYAPYVTRINLRGDTQHNVRLIPDMPEWDFENTKLLGWSDPVSGSYYYLEKFKAIAEDCRSYGSNCAVVNVNRSNGKQYHNGNCADGKGWWEHILDDGWAYQFCKKNASGAYDTSHAHFCYENIHESEELSVAWLDRMEERIRIIGESGQWCIVNLWCPYDNKWWGINWYYWTDDCSESPFTVGPNSRWYHPKQKVATQALLNRIKDLPYIIINDNWEEMGFHGSVDLAWKKKVFGWVQEIMPGVPYFVYVGDHTEDLPAVINWVNSEPGIAGVHTHYMLGEDVRGEFGVSADKRVLHTEELNLSASKTFEAIQWCLGNNDETCMYYGNYRDFMRGDGGPDTGKMARDEWNPKIKALLP